MDNSVQRNFILGDSWLYYKIYTGQKTSDAVLTEIIKPVADQLIANGIIDQWFFIRYADPKHHIRVRFHYNDPNHVGTIINALYPHFKMFVDQDLIWKLQIDTYQREIERYGKSSIALAESLFFHDSDMIVSFIDMIEGDEGEELRWLFSLRAIDNLLESFNYSLEDKVVLLESLKVGFRSEFDTSSFLGKQLNDKYRREKRKIQDFLQFKAADNPDYAPIIEVLEVKKAAIKNIVEELLLLKEKNQLERPLNDLMGSYIHMLMNRLFKSENRAHEMVCYDFLYRYYHSTLARMKHQKKAQLKKEVTV